VRVGVDLGGTKIEAIAMAHAGEILARARVPTPQGDYDRTLRAIVGLVAEVERTAGVHGTVGVAIPGTLSPASGVVKNANSTWLIGKPLDRDLSTGLERPVRFANDANCFALSEAIDGAAAGAASVFGVIIGTGTGGGFVIDRQVIVGANAIAGEWGHNPLPWPRENEWPGPSCYCGRTGCIETFLSGPGFAADFLRATGRDLVPEAIALLAADGDHAARACLDRYQDRFARAIAHVINVIDPHVIVLGGGMSNLDQLYASIPQRWSSFVFSDRVTTRLVKAQHGDSSGVRGAAWLWDESKDDR
jgi:fructokinase